VGAMMRNFINIIENAGVEYSLPKYWFRGMFLERRGLITFTLDNALDADQHWKMSGWLVLFFVSTFFMIVGFSVPIIGAIIFSQADVLSYILSVIALIVIVWPICWVIFFGSLKW
jgi:hypothetical protein